MGPTGEGCFFLQGHFKQIDKWRLRSPHGLPLQPINLILNAKILLLQKYTNNDINLIFTFYISCKLMKCKCMSRCPYSSFNCIICFKRKTWKFRKGLLAPADAGLASYIEARYRRIIKFKNAIGAAPSFSEIVSFFLQKTWALKS